eukprot:2986366-Heterocapsa_arctica.AAC.1
MCLTTINNLRSRARPHPTTLTVKAGNNRIGKRTLFGPLSFRTRLAETRPLASTCSKRASSE